MNLFKTKKQERGFREFLYVLPFVILTLIFCYAPLFGWSYAFFDYRPPFQPTKEDFVGLKWFKSMFATESMRKELFRVLRNTFAMSGISLLFSWFPMIFAVFLNEIKCKPFRKFVQTVTTLPNFISWVLVYAVAFCVFSSTGPINSIGMSKGWWDTQKLFLQDDSHLWFKMWLWLTWKNAGWASIMYLAAISGIDAELIEAARVDGANRLKVIRHITIPCLLPTYFVLVMMNVASFLSNGMEQYLVFQNSWTKNAIEVLDLYVYNQSLGGGGSYPFATAVSIFKTVFSMILLILVNKFSKKVRGESLI